MNWFNNLFTPTGTLPVRQREASVPGVPSSTMPPEPPKVEGGDYMERIVSARSPEDACSVSAVYRAMTLRADTMGVMPVQ